MLMRYNLLIRHSLTAMYQISIADLMSNMPCSYMHANVLEPETLKGCFQYIYIVNRLKATKFWK